MTDTDVFDRLDTRKLAEAIDGGRLARLDDCVWVRSGWQKGQGLGAPATGRVKTARLTPLLDAGYVVEGDDGVFRWTEPGAAAWAVVKGAKAASSGLTVRSIADGADARPLTPDDLDDMLLDATRARLAAPVGQVLAEYRTNWCDSCRWAGPGFEHGHDTVPVVVRIVAEVTT